MKTQTLVSILFLSLILLSCRFSGVKGSGILAEERRELDSFSELDISGTFEVNVILGEENKLHISAEDNLIPLIAANIKGSVLNVYPLKSISPTEAIIITITATELNSINSSGTSNISAKEINSDKFLVSLSGAGSISLSGKTNLLDVSLSGSGGLNSKDLFSKDVNISVSGVGNAVVNVSGILNAEVSGVGNIEYLGDPTKVSSNVSGVGSISRANPDEEN